MSVLVFGAEGMLGLALCHALAGTEAIGPIVAGIRGHVPRSPLPEGVRTAPHIEVMDLETVEAALEIHRPLTVVNAVGIVKNHPAAADVRTMMAVNGWFPHHLAALCQKHGCRLLHISTDCVFDGTRGSYTETDWVSARDPYGRSKALGEVCGRNVMTLRSSMIGLEGGTRRGLLAWFLESSGRVAGYTNAIFSGPTAPELARLVTGIILSPRPFGGLLHAGATPIDKHALLTLVRDAFALDMEVVPDGSLRVDRSLRTRALATRYRYAAPPWPQMIAELAAQWRAGAPAESARKDHAPA